MVSNRTIPELALDLGSFHVWSHLKIQDIFRYLKKSIDALYHEHCFFFFFYPKTSLPNSLNYIRSKYEFKHFIFSLFFFFHFTQAGTQVSLADLPFSNEIFTLWYNLLPSKQMPPRKNEEENEDSIFQPNQPLVDAIDLVSRNQRKQSLRFSKTAWDVLCCETGVLLFTSAVLPFSVRSSPFSPSFLKQKDNFQPCFKQGL